MANDIIGRISSPAPIIGKISGLSTEAALLAVQELTARTAAAETDIDALQADKADSADVYQKSEVYTKTEVDTKDATKADKAEIEAARGTEATLGARLDSTDAQLAEIETELNTPISPSKTDFFELDENMINPETMVAGKYVYELGYLVNSPYYDATDYVELLPDTLYYRINLMGRHAAFYDESKTLVQAFVTGNLLPNPFQVTSAVKYARFTRQIDIHGIPMLSKNPIVEFKPYKYKLKEQYASTEIEDALTIDGETWGVE